LAGHSKGGIAMQNYVKEFSQQNNILGQITLGSYLTRDKYILND